MHWFLKVILQYDDMSKSLKFAKEKLISLGQWKFEKKKLKQNSFSIGNYSLSKNEWQWQLPILWPFLAVFPPAVCLYFTKRRFRQSFWGAWRVWILIGSKIMASDVNGGLGRAWLTFKIYQPINEHFTTIFGHFLPTVWLSFTKMRFRQSFWGA